MEGALMAFDDYRRAWAVKGLTAPERLVLLALAERMELEDEKKQPPNYYIAAAMQHWFEVRGGDNSLN